MDYTQHGVLDAQMRVTERLDRILAEHGMVLDPGWPLWFDGRLELPTPGEPWTMRLSYRGACRRSSLPRPNSTRSSMCARPKLFRLSSDGPLTR